ncbi:location of vulva defective 1-like [Uloborus diversus]|uniref:location of vulva defective 1-like n=1 Tax=Uloborus diversus TaxID=327109 RepID=UPI00240A0B6A|nr:location of vulva defective 1-like [Uloborus diversus]
MKGKSISDVIYEVFPCRQPGNFSILLAASDGFVSENVSVLACCVYFIRRNWTVETDSPKITPPGEITLKVFYSGSEIYYPQNALVDIFFGDEQSDVDLSFSDKKDVVQTHTYEQEGEWNITIRIHNDVDEEIFMQQVLVLEKLGTLEVTLSYELDSNRRDPHGLERSDIPINSVALFTCKVSETAVSSLLWSHQSGIRTKICPRIDAESANKWDNRAAGILHVVGEYEATFQASNILEASNLVVLPVRVLSNPEGLQLLASRTSAEVGDEIEFTIQFEQLDELSCLSFDPRADREVQAFGNEEVCAKNLPRHRFHPREDTSILYIYRSGGMFKPNATAFNSIYQSEASLNIEVSYAPSNIWIEENSTNIFQPMQFRRSETFRLETTALLVDSPNYRYEMSWYVDEITESDQVLRSVDVSGFASSNCSAIRFPVRFLDVGLYKVTYSILVLENEEPAETLSCYTYLEIVSSSLRPMIIRGGASYVLRGYGQVVYLQPGTYSDDPDDPDDKVFEVDWSCRCFEPQGYLATDEEYDSNFALSRKILTPVLLEDITFSENCFKNGKERVLQEANIVFNTKDLVGYYTTYEITVIVSKGTRNRRALIYLDVIKETPPGIIIMCEKPVACIAVEDGFIVSPNRWLSIRTECVTDCGDAEVEFEWFIYAVDGTRSNDPVTLDGWIEHVIVDKNRLGINQTFFSRFQQYKHFHIQVIGSVAGRPQGVAKLYIQLNNPPEGGECVLRDIVGHAMITVFQLEFKNWRDPEDHRIRDYSVYMLKKGKKFRLHYGVKVKVDFVLPPGKSEIFCAVEDELGAVTTLSAGFVDAVIPSTNDIEEWGSRVNLKFFVVEGQMPLMAQFIASAAYAEKQDRMDNYRSVSEEVDLVWKSYLELSGIDSSYNTKEAKEEIEAGIYDGRAQAKDRLAKKNLEMFKAMEFLPFEVLADSEVYGQAVSALSETRPLNKGSKKELSKFLEKMFESSEKTPVAHTTEKQVSDMLLTNSMNCFSKTLAEEVLGGNYLDSELEDAFDFLNYNLTEPNVFILYVEGSRWEVVEKVHQKKVEGAKNLSKDEVKDEINLMKQLSVAISERMIRDAMVNQNPMEVDTTSGFQIKVEKKLIGDISESVAENSNTAMTLPSGCVLLGKPEDCADDTAIGLVSVLWSSILEVDGADDVNLSPESSTLDFSLTNHEGNASLEVKNLKEPIEICLSLTPPSEDKDFNVNSMQRIKPDFNGKDDFLVYHKVRVDKLGTVVKMEFISAEKEGNFVFLYAVGFKPALKAHDGKYFSQSSAAGGGTTFIYFNERSDIGDDFYVAVGLLFSNGDLENDGNLTRDDMTNHFGEGYSIGLYKTGCYYYSEETSTWTSYGCKVHSADANRICCYCNHLTTFGSGFLVAPNTIDFEYVFANTGFEDNLIIYITLIITFSLYVILVIWARWKDRKDLTKLDATPLLDNDIKDRYFYEILVQTGFHFNAGTKSKVHFILSGEDDETDVRTFADKERTIFKRGAMNTFVMAVPRCLGQLNYLRIWHDNSGPGKHASWYLNYIVVKDIHTRYKYEFIVDRWLAVEEGDGLIDHLIPVAGKEQTTQFSHLFPNASRRNLSDNHLWLSVFMRPARSRFTRVQRVSCCLALLYLSMLASAMWYETTPEQPSPGAFKFGPLSLSPEQISVGLMSNLVVFPPTFLMVFFFRKSRARILRKSHVNVALHQQYARWRKDYGSCDVQKHKGKLTTKQTRRADDEESQNRIPFKKSRCCLPWWCVYISWLLVILSVGSSMFFIWAYGLQFGNERTRKWLTSLVIAFFSSVLLTEPIKIFCLALIMACLCGNPDVDEDDADIDEEDPYLESDEEWLHNIDKGITVQRPKYLPIDPLALEAARKVREKEVRMYQVLKEIGVYALYLWILMILSFGNRDPNSFYIRETTINNFIKPGDLWNDFNKINNEVRFWNWTREALLPELFAGVWYNGRPPLGLRLLIDDRSNFKIGYPVLRQIRTRKDSCTVSRFVESIIPDCAGYSSLINEESRFYKKFWYRNLTMSSKIPPEYKYMTAKQLNGFPFWGQLDWYGGGGYIVPLIAKRYEDGAKLIQKMYELEKNGWINQDTRAVFIEFGTYNAQVNLFVVVTIVAEFVPGGGIVPYYHIDPIKLLQYHTGSGLLQMICQIGFIIFTIYHSICQFAALYRDGRKYFSQYWNIAETFNLLAAYASISAEVYKLILTWRILEIFTATEGTGYIKLQEVLLLDEAFCYLIGFLMSLATLKFIKLLRFNKRIGSMTATLRLCAKELKGYSICLLVVFFAFVALFWLTLGRGVREFCSFFASFESSISMMLKKFNYEDMESASPVVAPLAFFTFALTASVILVNILLTIIIQSFEEVKYDVKLQNSDYELLPFIIARLKLLLGLNKSRKGRVEPAVTIKPETAKKSDVVDSFNGKVDLLLKFVNSVYLDEQMDLDFLKKSQNLFTNPPTDTRKETKKARPRKIPSYIPLHMKKHLDF